MTGLQKISENRANTPRRTNIVIVPGNNGETLADQTCSHFPSWLNDIVASETKCTGVWIFRHDIQVDSLTSWFAYCEAGERLLQALTNMQKDDGLSDNDTLILIGHKMGSFVLKKALLEAHRSSHHRNMDTLLNTIETLVIVGDPDLNSNNQNEWIPLISKCLPCKTLPKQLNCPQDAKCLQHVAACFEEFTLHSTLFQVSSAAESKRWLPLRIHRGDPRCICSASMSVRMWTTTSEEVTVPPGDGDKKDCAFYQKSALYNPLLSITNFDPRFSLSGNPAQLSVLEAQTSDGLRPYLPMDENATDVTRNGPASPQATFLTIHPVPSVETPPLMNVEPASRCDTISARGAPDEADSKNHDDQYPDPRKTTQNFLATEASIEPESLPCCDDGIKSLESTIFEQAEDEDSVTHGMQQTSSGVLSVLLPPVARRSPFLSMRVPGRDARFFGREDLLIPLEALLTPVSMLPSGHLASLDSGAVIVLHGEPGVGKSAIALELTYRIQATFDHVFWIRASSKLHLAQSFHEAAVSLGLARDRINHNHESSRQKLMAWLSTTTSNWLLVFNDADEPQILPPFMPNRRRGSIILTSRQPFREGLYFKKDECLHTFQIDPFAVEDATEFMLSLAPSAFGAANPAADLATLKTIAEDCHCLPLTLRLVGTNLSRRSSSKNKRIMAILEQHAGRVLTSQPSSPLFYANLSPASCALANVITFLDPYCINDAILLGAQRYKDIPLSAFPTSDHDYFNAKNELITHALLAANADSSVLGIHRVMARSIRAKLDPENFRGSFHIASRLLEGRWPSRRKMKNIVVGNWPEFDALHCHVHELSKIFVEYDRERKKGTLKQELSNDSYLKVLFLSTWYNAHRGNAEEDQVLIHLAHGLIARSQRPDPRLLHEEISSTALPARLVDVGLDKTQSLCLVNTAGQTGFYVALSYCCYPQGSSETQLTKANMSRLVRSIEPSDLGRCAMDAIELTRSLGVRYIWIGGLCVVQDDHEDRLNAMSRVSDIYRSAILTVAPVGTYDETVDYCIDSSVLGQPFSIFLDWSRPTIAKSCSARLFTRDTLDLWSACRRFVHGCFAAAQILESDTAHEDISDSDRLQDAEAVQLEVDATDTKHDEARHAIFQGVHYAETGKDFEALALFLKARELVGAFQLLTPRSWKMYAEASANIGLVYQKQHLLAMALDITEGSLAVQSKLPIVDCNTSLERVRLHFVMGGIYNALKKPDESLNCYKAASNDLKRLPEEANSSEIADWKGVLDLKLAEQRMRTKDYKEAHALLQQSLDHFQSQESLSAQAHLARSLHWQSVVFEAQGSKIMGNAIKAAAKQTWIGVREARGHAVSKGITSLRTEDFDGEVEFWCR